MFWHICTLSKPSLLCSVLRILHKLPGTRWLEEAGLVSHRLEAGKVQGQGAGRLGSWLTRDPSLTVSSRAGGRQLSGVSSDKGIDLIRPGPHPHDLSHPWVPPKGSTSLHTLGCRASAWEFWGDTIQALQPQSRWRTYPSSPPSVRLSLHTLPHLPVFYFIDLCS